MPTHCFFQRDALVSSKFAPILYCLKSDQDSSVLWEKISQSRDRKTTGLTNRYFQTHYDQALVAFLQQGVALANQ